MKLERTCVLLSGLLLVGCPAAPIEPPPPPRKAEILPAPPRALGAYAAGTDAAPKPAVADPPVDPEAPPTPTPPPVGAAPDAGVEPDAPPPAPHPDAGTAL